MAKYDSIRKNARNQLLILYQQGHPDASLKEIGAMFNISPQRVWEIIQLYKKNTDKEQKR
jgi:predicted transcriptional regulator